MSAADMDDDDDRVTSAQELRDAKDELTVLVILTRANAPLSFSRLRRLVPGGIGTNLLNRILDRLIAAGKVSRRKNPEFGLDGYGYSVPMDLGNLKPWQQPWKGKHWYDMPGQCEEMKKLNFFLWRHGLDQYVTAYMEGGREEQRRIHNTRTSRRITLSAERAESETGEKRPRPNNGFKPVERTARQASLLERFKALPKPWGFGAWFETAAEVSGETLAAFRHDLHGLTPRVLERLDAAISDAEAGKAVYVRMKDRAKVQKKKEAA